MELVQEPVDHRRDQNRHRTEKSDAAEESVCGSEDLGGVRFHLVDRTHPRQDHRSVEQGVDPREASNPVIAERSERQRSSDEHKCQNQAARQTPVELAFRQQGLASMLKHNYFSRSRPRLSPLTLQNPIRALPELLGKLDYRLHPRREIPLQPCSGEKFDRAREKRSGGFPSSTVMLGDSGKPRCGGIIFTDHIKPVAERAGIGKVGWHTFRHMFSSVLHDAGTSMAVQKELLRHANISTAMNVYTQAVAPAKREAVRQVAVALMGA